MRARASLAVATGLLAALAASCGAGSATSSRCQTDAQCGDGLACAAGTCLPRAAPPASWNIELDPRSDSAYALTELPSVSMPADAYDLTATSKVTLTGTLTFDASAAPLATAHIVLAVPSTLPGLADLQFETDLTTGAKAAAPTFTLPIPSGVVGHAGTLRVLPGAPDNATHAPSTFTVAIAPTLMLPVTSASLTVSGRLLTALGDPLGGLVARAFQDGALVSNVIQTTMDGSFSLVVPADLNAPALAVELEAASTDAPQPHFWAKPFPLTGSTDLGDVQLPAYGQPNAFTFAFQGANKSDPAVAGALVRAHTVLADDMTGTTDFERDGQTDMTGQAGLSLVPGSMAALRLYDIAIVPPAGSVYATKCLEMFGLAAGGLQPTVTLDRRPVLAGSVLGADGSPAGGVVIQATPSASATPTACDEYASPPQVTGTTKMDGSFSLVLDAGTYTLDLDPPAGAPFPRLTELGVVVTAGGGPYDVTLPPGAVVEGTLSDGAGNGLAQAGVRFYGPACAPPSCAAGTPPVLEAQAHADASGHYRAVIPIVPSAPGAQ